MTDGLSKQETKIDTTPHTGGALDKRHAWNKWAVRHFSKLRSLHSSGVLSKDSPFRNVAEHLLVSNATSVFLARKLKTSGVEVDEQLVDDASILHDVAKRVQREKGISYENETRIPITGDMLSSMGYSEDVVRVASYTGRVPEIYIEDDVRQTEAIARIPLEQLVVAYADARVRNTDIVSLEEARDLNKEKIFSDATFYDKWYRFYKKVEERIFAEMGDSIKPEDVNNSSVFEMVKG